MKYQFIIATILVGVCQSSFAESGIQGKWKMIKSECSSGAPYSDFNDANMHGKIDMIAELSSDQIRNTFTIHEKYDKAAAEAYLKQIKQNIELAKQKPDGPGKENDLRDLNESLRTMQLFEAGVNCVIKEIHSYSLNGSTFHSGPLLQRSSNCPGDPGDEDTNAFDTTFEVSGHTLKITDDTPESETNSSCPKGDKTITYFERMK